MADDQDGFECVSVSSGTGLPGFPGPKAVKQLCVCVLCNYIFKYFSVWAVFC